MGRIGKEREAVEDITPKKLYKEDYGRKYYGKS
jgi:hypothetical protein